MMTRKETILAAATKLFADRGFHETSTSEIAKLTGVSEGSIFYHFKNKEDLLLNILQQIKERILEEFSIYKADAQKVNGMEQMLEVVSFYLYLAGKMEDDFILLERRYLYQLAQVNPICSQYLQEIYECLMDFFEEPILKGRRDGSVGSMASRKSALLILTMVDGLVRFRNCNLYNTAALHVELINACRRILEPDFNPKTDSK